jgi:hypothetical protein
MPATANPVGRGVALAGDLLPLGVDDHHHVGRHEALRHARRRGHDALIVEAYADVAVVRGDVALPVQTAADFTDVGANGFVGRHDDPRSPA